MSESLPQSHNLPINSRGRPRPTRKARLWDRLLNATERRNANSSPNAHWDEDITYAPRDVGDVHLRQSFEDALINQGLAVTAEFTLTVEPSNKRGKSARAKRCRPIIHTNNAPLTPLSAPVTHRLPIIDDDQNALEIPRKKLTRTSLLKIRQPSGLPPSDLPLINRKARQKQTISPDNRQLSIRDRLRIDQESNKPPMPPISFQPDSLPVLECREDRDTSKSVSLSSPPLTPVKPGRASRGSTAMKQPRRSGLSSEPNRKRRKLAPSKNTNACKASVVPTPLSKKKSVIVIDVDALTDSEVDTQQESAVATEDNRHQNITSHIRRKPRIVSDSSDADDEGVSGLLCSNSSSTFQNSGRPRLSCDTDDDCEALYPVLPPSGRHRPGSAPKLDRTSTGNLPPRPIVLKKPAQSRSHASLTSNLECHLVNGQRTNRQSDDELTQKTYSCQQDTPSNGILTYRNVTAHNNHQQDHSFDRIQLPQLSPMTRGSADLVHTSGSASKFSSHSSSSGRVSKSLKMKPVSQPSGENNVKSVASGSQNSNSVYFVLDDDFCVGKSPLSSSKNEVVDLCENSEEYSSTSPGAQALTSGTNRDGDIVLASRVGQSKSKTDYTLAGGQGYNARFAPVLDDPNHEPHRVAINNVNTKKRLYSTPAPLTQTPLPPLNIREENGLQRVFNSEQTPSIRNETSSPINQFLPETVVNCSQPVQIALWSEEIDDEAVNSCVPYPARGKSPEKDKSTVATETESTSDEVHPITPTLRAPSGIATSRECLSTAKDALFVDVLSGYTNDGSTVGGIRSKRHAKPTDLSAPSSSDSGEDRYGLESSDKPRNSSFLEDTPAVDKSVGGHYNTNENRTKGILQSEFSEIAPQPNESPTRKHGDGNDSDVPGCEETIRFNGNDSDQWPCSIPPSHGPRSNPLMTEAAYDLFASHCNVMPQVSLYMGAVRCTRDVCVTEGFSAQTNKCVIPNITRSCNIGATEVREKVDTYYQQREEAIRPAGETNPDIAKIGSEQSPQQALRSREVELVSESRRPKLADRDQNVSDLFVENLAEGIATRVLRPIAECIDRDTSVEDQCRMHEENSLYSLGHLKTINPDIMEAGEAAIATSLSRQFAPTLRNKPMTNCEPSAGMKECRDTENPPTTKSYELENPPLTLNRPESSITTLAASTNARGKRYPTLTPATPLHASVYKRRMDLKCVGAPTFSIFCHAVREFMCNNEQRSWPFSLMRRIAPPLLFHSNFVSPRNILRKGNSLSIGYSPSPCKALNPRRIRSSLTGCTSPNSNSTRKLTPSNGDIHRLSEDSPHIGVPSITQTSVLVYPNPTFAAICNFEGDDCLQTPRDRGQHVAETKDNGNACDIEIRCESDDTSNGSRNKEVLRAVNTSFEETTENAKGVGNDIAIIKGVLSIIHKDSSGSDVFDKQGLTGCNISPNNNVHHEKTSSLTMSYQTVKSLHHQNQVQPPTSQDERSSGKFNDLLLALRHHWGEGISTTTPIQEQTDLENCNTQWNGESSLTKSGALHNQVEVGGLKRSFQQRRCEDVLVAEPVLKKRRALDHRTAQWNDESPRMGSEVLGAQFSAKVDSSSHPNAIQLVTLPPTEEGDDSTKKNGGSTNAGSDYVADKNVQLEKAATEKHDCANFTTPTVSVDPLSDVFETKVQVDFQENFESQLATSIRLQDGSDFTIPLHLKVRPRR